jgi:small-conductance mechanosensitive channel
MHTRGGSAPGRKENEMEGIQNWGDALWASMAGAMAMLLAAVPKIIGFLLILAVGWFIASLVARGVAALLRTVQFNELAQRSGFAGFVRSMGVQTDSSGFLALITKWFVRLIVLVAAFDALGIQAVSGVLQQLLMWLPNLVVALVILVIGGLAARALSGLVRGAVERSQLGNPDLLAGIARVAVWAFAIVVAINQIGIAQTLINTLFMATVGAVALALGLAFGLGGRETASEIVRGWYQRGRQAAPRMKEAAQQIGEQARHDGGRLPPYEDMPPRDPTRRH